jgi:hypothetical protein
MQIILLIMVGIIVGGGFAVSNVEKKQPASTLGALRLEETVRILTTLKSELKNPSGLQIEEVLRLPDGTHCITFRARNEEDVTELGYAIGKEAGLAISSSDDTLEWTRRCSGGTGIDVTHARRAL